MSSLFSSWWVHTEVLTTDESWDTARWRISLNPPYVCLSTSPLPHRCQALQHSGQLSRGDQAVRLWCERPAHRFHGQLLCWNALLHVGESALHACAPTPFFFFSLALSPLSFSSFFFFFLTLLLLTGPALYPPFLWPSLTSLPRTWGPCPGKGLFGKERRNCVRSFLSSFPLSLRHLVGAVSCLYDTHPQTRTRHTCPFIIIPNTHICPCSLF